MSRATGIADIQRRLRALGAKPCHEDHLLRLWTRARSLDPAGFSETQRPPAAVCRELPTLAAELDGLLRLRSEHPDDEEGTRLLLELGDGETVESVLLPRGGICVSTQVGCAVGCVFCMTGRDGLRRQLGSAEIVAQVVAARRRQTVRKVVFMGMGEPAHNLDNVLEAIDVLGSHGDIGHKNLVFSTVGDHRVFERLPRERVRPALALSLHTTRAELRARLLPKAPAIEPAELVQLGDDYAIATGYPIQYQWTLIDGVNDSDEEFEQLARLLAGKYAVMNLIPYNRIDGLEFRRPSEERAAALSLFLYRRGILTKLRQSAAQTVDGGCGQLRARSIAAAI